MEQQMPFGLWLRQRRNDLDLAQWELAERVGCSRDTIQKIESGSRRPSKQVAELLTTCLGIAPAERSAIINWARGGPPPATAALSTSSPTQSASQTAELPQDFAPPPINLPSPLTSLIGREQAIQAVRSYLLRDDVRLLSLIGPPGVGKTRLAIAGAFSAAGAFKDGVHFVALENVTDPNQVAAAIADSLEIRPFADQAVMEAVTEHLRPRRVLLLLDNFEQVLDAGLSVLELISACPALKVMVTSREALHVHGEWQYTVPPLKLPSANLLSEKKLNTLSSVPAIALFTQRAQAIKSDFGLDADNALLVSDICARLDGLPLAIELAATRVSSLSLAEILSGLGRLKLLTGHLRNLPSRQRTLRGAIDWSYHLLDASERALFRRLGVFAGGCTLAGAEAVCRAPNTLPDSPSAQTSDMIEGCRSLVEKSLLRFESAKTEKDGEGRYAMLEVLREYALEQLGSSGEENDARRRHALYYVALAEAASPRLYGPEQGKVLRELETENDNFRAALRWSLESGVEGVETALRLSGALGKFWDVRGYVSEGRRWLEEALENASRPGPMESAAAALAPLVRIKALTALGGLAAIQGEHIAARSSHEQALTLARMTDNKTFIGTCLLNLANVDNHLGEYDEALQLYEQALALFRALDDKPWIARTLVNMGFCARSRGENEKARALYEESLVVRKELGDRFGIALVLGNLGELAVHRRDYHQARAHLEASLSIRHEIGDERGIAFCQKCLATLELADQHLAQACGLLQSSLGIYQQMRDREAIASCLELLPELCMSIGQTELGVRLWGAAEALRQAIRTPIPPGQRLAYDQAVARARAELSDAEFEHAWSVGSQLTMEDAIACALEITEST